MADYAIVIKACSKIVCHALSRIKTKAMLWILFSGFAGIFTVYLYLIFFFYVRPYWVIYLLFIPQLFLLRPLRDVNFTASLPRGKGFISRYDHIFHGYSNRHFTFSPYQHCLSHSTCTMIAIGHISNIIELAM